MIRIVGLYITWSRHDKFMSFLKCYEVGDGVEAEIEGAWEQSVERISGVRNNKEWIYIT